MLSGPKKRFVQRQRNMLTVTRHMISLLFGESLAWIYFQRNGRIALTTVLIGERHPFFDGFNGVSGFLGILAAQFEVGV